MQPVCGIPDSYRAVCSASLDSAVQRTRRGLSRQTGTVSDAAWPASDRQAVSLPAPRSVRMHNQHHNKEPIFHQVWDVAEYERSSYSVVRWKCVGRHTVYTPLFSRKGIIWFVFQGVSSLLLSVRTILLALFHFCKVVML